MTQYLLAGPPSLRVVKGANGMFSWNNIIPEKRFPRFVEVRKYN